MNNKVMKFGYEDTDQKIEIELYGLLFEIDKDKIINKDINKIDSNDENLIENEIEDILGKDSIEKINNKRINDGYKKMTLDVEIAVLTCIYKSYIQATTGTMIEGINNTNKELENKAKSINNNYNREQRRYNNRKRNYRRY